MKPKNLLLKLILFLIFSQLVFAQSISPDKVIEIKTIVPHAISSAGLVDVEIILNIKKEWHINSNKPLDENLVPTVLSFKEIPGIQIQKITYPKPSIEKLPFMESQLSLYENEVIIRVQFKVNKKSGIKQFNLEGTVKYQPCNNQTCLFPVSKQFSIILAPNKAK